ncbi:MAG TPA: sulfate adenylyltransferase [bacterium]|nr:sulfate adenylyltransferase [bacterium]
MHFPLPPHGGELINIQASGAEREIGLAKAASLPRLTLNDREMADIDMMACGALSPLKGFMGQADYESVVEKMRLANGLVWSIPITLSVKEENAPKYDVGADVALYAPTGEVLAILHLKEKYKYSMENEAEKVYKTKEDKHPGVAAVYAQGPIYLAGPITVLNRVKYADFNEYRKDPADLRKIFQEKKWKTIVGFQTRNPIHRAHEYIQKCALEIVDGLLVHPLVGATKSDDVPASVRMQCYEALLKNYYPLDRTHLAVFPAAMRYAGPREAIFHAIARKNYGCTHFIVGRDHAGVGNYYGTYEAQELFDRFEIEELGIMPLKFENSFWCKRTGGMATAKTSPSTPDEQISLSGTKVREMLRAGQLPPPEFSRPEVAKILIEAMKGQG